MRAFERQVRRRPKGCPSQHLHLAEPFELARPPIGRRTSKVERRVFGGIARAPVRLSLLLICDCVRVRAAPRSSLGDNLGSSWLFVCSAYSRSPLRLAHLCRPRRPPPIELHSRAEVEAGLVGVRVGRIFCATCSSHLIRAARRALARACRESACACANENEKENGLCIWRAQMQSARARPTRAGIKRRRAACARRQETTGGGPINLASFKTNDRRTSWRAPSVRPFTYSMH